MIYSKLPTLFDLDRLKQLGTRWEPQGAVACTSFLLWKGTLFCRLQNARVTKKRASININARNVLEKFLLTQRLIMLRPLYNRK
ncbi:hypothetical protein DFQ30_004557 [Apophysomyces sp. BC1015]|nr:hypothetical protein DFQ30_004557 [Apophysomyces sp. BC1015]